jgi:hypothetical protein
MPSIKMNISLDASVAATLRRRSREISKPASRYISDLIVEDERAQRDALAAEGYRALSGESRELEEEAWKIAAEGWPEWDNRECDNAEAAPR